MYLIGLSLLETGLIMSFYVLGPWPIALYPFISVSCPYS